MATDCFARVARTLLAYAGSRGEPPIDIHLAPTSGKSPAGSRPNLGHLQWLTRPVGQAGPEARAIAVYAEPDPLQAEGAYVLRSAREQGVEGVACVDDAARAAVLYCNLWLRHGLATDRAIAHGLLRFLAHMQDPDGRFTNFIVDWDGNKNLTGTTSALGGQPWQARALHALAWGVSTFDEPEWGERFDRALPWVDVASPHLDVRAVCVLAALQHWQATGAASSSERALAWAEEIAAAHSGGSLVNAADVKPIHLWGHLQEAALVATGQSLQRVELVECARTSADVLLLPAAERCSTAPRMLPFEVSCLVVGLSAVARATGEPRYAEAAADAQAWFQGQNAAGRPVYDPRRGLFYDGIDDGRISRNSGAESNLEGALTLLV